MRIGILSDSHGRAAITARAVRALLEQGAELLIHLGDVETIEVIDELVGCAPAGARIVFGNCDNERTLARYAESVDITVDHPMGMLEVDGKTIAFTHGHLDECMRDALAQGVAYLLCGHSHETCDEKHRATRVINPGALFHAPRYTVALLDPAEDTLRSIELPRTG